MSDYSIYPDAIDGYSQLPLTVDTVTPVDAKSVNRLRSAILNIEGTLGVNPEGDYETVDARLDALEGSTSIDTVESSVELTFNDYRTVLVDASDGDVTITLPDATERTGRFEIKKIDSSSNTVTIETQESQTIDGSEGIIIDFQYDSYTVVSNQENWFIV